MVHMGNYCGKPKPLKADWHGLTIPHISARVDTCVSTTLHCHYQLSTLSKSFRAREANPAGAQQLSEFFFGKLTGKPHSHFIHCMVEKLNSWLQLAPQSFKGPKGIPSLQLFTASATSRGMPPSVLSLIEVIHTMRQRKPGTLGHEATGPGPDCWQQGPVGQ